MKLFARTAALTAILALSASPAFAQGPPEGTPTADDNPGSQYRPDERPTADDNPGSQSRPDDTPTAEDNPGTRQGRGQPG